MKLLFVLELGLLHYRIPIIDQISRSEHIEQCDVIHTEEYTGKNYHFRELKTEVRNYGKIKLLPDVKHLKDNYDIIVFSFNLWRPNWFYTLFKSRKAKYILWGQGFGRSNNYLVARMAKIAFAHWADALIFYTPSGCDDFNRFGVGRHKMFVAQNTLHVENAGLTSTTFKKDLLYVGRIQERKGIDQLIRAFALISDEIHHSISIRIVGDGDITDLRRIATEHKVEDRVIFEPGAFDAEELKAKFASALVYVSPNHVGLGVVHSFAYGVPVITNRNRKHAPEFEYCDASNSLVYEGGISELAAALREICNNKKLQEELSDGSYNYYNKHLQAGTMVNGFLSAFDFVLNRRKMIA
ncbi:glycosyltransferase family 4 protein [Pontibacter ramchanderi]|uniref:Glycosyltransferase involved in cell wall biosynthesis n=1 Tax=Pontibacter ramchanderi TaxID=1179743 RepID=A0A2N3U7R2_9BACT|nr:glycosyltransferase [Pontibacter ramchanderi]PKV62788.1 glycosyltransferase involved in cell wall biosynthesis [Pontibacter ramchanderi]